MNSVLTLPIFSGSRDLKILIGFEKLRIQPKIYCEIRECENIQIQYSLEKNVLISADMLIRGIYLVTLHSKLQIIKPTIEYKIIDYTYDYFTHSSRKKVTFKKQKNNQARLIIYREGSEKKILWASFSNDCKIKKHLDINYISLTICDIEKLTSKLKKHSNFFELYQLGHEFSGRDHHGNRIMGLIQ